MSFCQYCGSPIGENDRFCSKCGKPVPAKTDTASSPPPSLVQTSLLETQEVIFQKYTGSYPPHWSIQDSEGNKIGEVIGFIEHHRLGLKVIDNSGKLLATSLQSKLFDPHGEFVITSPDGSELGTLRRLNSGVGLGVPLVFIIEQKGQEYLHILSGSDGDIWKRNYQMEMNQVPVVIIRKIVYTWTELKFSVSITGDVGHGLVLSAIPTIDHGIDLMREGR